MKYFKSLNLLLPQVAGYALVALAIGMVIAMVSLIFVSAIKSAL